MNKQEQYKNMLKFGLSFVVWAAVSAVWAWTWMSGYASAILRPFGYKGNWLVFAVYGLLNLFFTSFYGGYRIGYYRREDVMFSGVLSLVLTNIVTYLQTCLVGRAIMDALPFLRMTAIQIVIIPLWAYAASAIYTRAFPPHTMLMVYGGRESAHNLIGKMVTRSEKYLIREVISIEEGVDAVCRKMAGYQAVVLSDLPTTRRNILLQFCFEHSIRVYTPPELPDILLRGASYINLFDTPLLLNRNKGLTFEQRFLKRAVDIVISALGLLLGSPFILITAFAVRLCDRGPIFIRQKRLTQDGRVFYLYKFRSMVVDAEKSSGAQLCTKDDDRITPVGKIIRQIRFDELPQLWNILRGDMSVVGPRPERPELAEQYIKEMPEFAYRLKVKAGLTGLAQVNGKYNTTAYDKLRMDLMYITNYSLVQDIKILLMTAKILFVKDSTEGVADWSAQGNSGMEIKK